MEEQDNVKVMAVAIDIKKILEKYPTATVANLIYSIDNNELTVRGIEIVSDTEASSEEQPS